MRNLPMKIRAYRDSDWLDWLRMSQALFPHHTAEELAAGMREFRTRSDGAVFLAERGDGSLAGFVEVGTRPYADGCETSPVGYIEAWYVDPDVRRSGYGRALLAAAEVWARERGYQEMASDALLDNEVSHAAHRRAGYEKVERVVQFRKVLDADPEHRDMESSVNYQSISLQQKFALFSEQWQPKVIAEMNDYQFKVVKLQGDFVWHDHKDTDETFIVVEGVLRIDFRDGAVEVSAGEMFVVPRGVEHKPFAEHEVKLLLIEPRGVLNTGHAGGDRTAVNDVWI